MAWLKMLREHHKAKIVSVDQLLIALHHRPRPEGHAVVLCAGVFDIVHPGHLRHLAYARSRADVLVCAVTSDNHVAKGPNRPHVPQELRAAGLALLDIVDYVVIWDEERPDALITLLQPDYYAKGFEYAPGNHGHAIGEVGAVEAYGGEVLYTPGDVVYSSTAILSKSAPDLRWDLLAALMRSRDLSFDSLRASVRDLRDQRVHVVGDAIVDVILHCDLIGANAKTPTISVRRGASDRFVGGAAVVAKHARATGAFARLTTVLGQDDAGEFLVGDLEARGVVVVAAEDRARPTTVKEVVVVDGYRVLKIDAVDNRPVSGAVLRRLADSVRATAGGGAVVFSDFRHGVFHAHSISELSGCIPDGYLRVADSQVASRWGNICDFRGFDLLTPNEREARFALGDQDSGVRPLAARLAREAAARWLLMKMGSRGVLGMAETESAWAGEDRSFALGSYAGAVADPVGAGDAFLAYSTLSLLARPGCLATAAILGSFAAAAECEYDGNVPVEPEQVLAKIDEAERELR